MMIIIIMWMRDESIYIYIYYTPDSHKQTGLFHVCKHDRVIFFSLLGSGKQLYFAVL